MRRFSLLKKENEALVLNMGNKILGRINGEGFDSIIYQDDSNRVWFKADADIDADGANGQNGKIAAYRVDNKGSEDLANGGMAIKNGKVICAQSWARDIVILGSDNQPKVFPGGVIASRTWYRYPNKNINDPSAYVDSETVPYIVVPPLIVQITKGIVRGCKARVTYKKKSVEAVVADLGPRNKNGEISIELARQLGINPSPRNGGLNKNELIYELWPGIPAKGFELQRA